MWRDTISALGLFAAAVCIAVALFVGLRAGAQDDPPRPLDARYHQLPQTLVDKLTKQTPRPNGDWDCHTHDAAVSYCICWSREACRGLMKSGLCAAKLGAITSETGVCRSRIDEVVID